MKTVLRLICINAFIFLLIFLTTVLSLEIFLRLYPARVSDEGPNTSTFYLKKLMKDDVLMANYFGEVCKTKYRDYYYYSFSCKSERLNTTDYYDSRATPHSSKNEGAKTVWIFGGSTMINLTAPDELTIANQIALHANKLGTDLKVVNFGMGGFSSSSELIKYIDLLRRVPVSERPDIVVFYDGYNDAAQSATFGAGNLQEDLNGKIRSVVENQIELLPSILSKYAAQHSFVWKKWGEPIVQNAYFNGLVSKRPLAETDPGKAVALYVQNTKMAKAISDEYGIHVLFVLQPMIFTKRHLTDMEKDVMRYVVEPNLQHLKYMRGWYELAKTYMKGKEDYFDATDVMDGSPDDDYIDHGHMGPESGRRVAIPISEKIISKLKTH